MAESSSPTEPARGEPSPDSAHTIALRLTAIFGLLILTFSTPVGDCDFSVLIGFPVPMVGFGRWQEGVVPFGWAINLVADAVLAALFFRGVKRFVAEKSATSVWVGGLGLALFYGLFTSTTVLLISVADLPMPTHLFSIVIYVIGPFYYPLFAFVDFVDKNYHHLAWYDGFIDIIILYVPRVLLLPTLLLHWLLWSGLIVLWRRFRRLFGRPIP